MNYLLDTHTFLWFINGDEQLSMKARQAIETPNVRKYISIASFWEIAIKISLGKLFLDMAYSDLRQQVVKNAFDILPITFKHTNELLNLDLYHRDPFDRIIIAQAIHENLVLISKDKYFKEYDKLKLLW